MAEKLLEFSEAFKGFSEQDVDIKKITVRQREKLEDKTRIQIRGLKEEVSVCKESVAFDECLESNFTEWLRERIELKNEVDNLKKVNDESVKEIDN